jgi:hypothetical protein
MAQGSRDWNASHIEPIRWARFPLTDFGHNAADLPGKAKRDRRTRRVKGGVPIHAR